MRHHPGIDTALVIGAAALALAAGAGASVLGAGPILASAIAGAVVAGLLAWRAVDGIAAFGLTILLADTVEYWTGASLPYVDEAGLPLMALAAVTAHRRRLSLPRIGVREGLLVAFLLAGLASSLANGVPATVWLPGLALLVKGFVFFYLVLSLPVTADDVRRVAPPVVALGLLILLVGVVQLAFPDLARTALGVPPYGEQRGAIQVVNSWFTHPALYGWLAAFLSLVFLARFSILREPWALVAGIVVGGASLLSGRRTPAVGIVLGLAVGAVREWVARRASLRTWAAVAAGVLVVAALSVPIFGDFYRGTFTDYFGRPQVIAEVFDERPNGRRIAKLQARVALYAGSVAIARDELPLGAGIGRYGSHMSREEYSPVYREYRLHRVYGLRERRPIAVTDTFWPMILGETGVVGLAAAVGFFALLGRDLWRAAAPLGPPAVRIATLAALMIYAEALLRSLGSAVFTAPPVAYWVWGVAGLSLALRRTILAIEDEREPDAA